jgi:6-phosphofructokinase 1
LCSNCVRFADVLEIKTIRDCLTPRDSPFLEDNNGGGGFGNGCCYASGPGAIVHPVHALAAVGDTDKVRLHTVQFESSDSAGESHMAWWCMSPNRPVLFVPLWSTGAICSNGILANTFDEETCQILPEWSIRSGPRQKIYFNPSEVRTDLGLPPCPPATAVIVLTTPVYAGVCCHRDLRRPLPGAE